MDRFYPLDPELGAPRADRREILRGVMGGESFEIIRASDRVPLTPPDGSEVRELARPPASTHNQSLAEARVPPGAATVEHFHHASEEIYYVLEGEGRLKLGHEVAPVKAGEAVVIPPGIRHKLLNTGAAPLVLLCCCAPPYSDEDTVLCE
jgi:mannose-6-phosphate isomerase-like protein (cupin superfamily)